MSSFGRFPKQFNVPIPKDETGMVGRECPVSECEGYFKLQFGTGLKGANLPCHCPYCGHAGQSNDFFTKEQIEYAKSVVMREFGSYVTRELKKFEFNHPPRGMFGIGIIAKVVEGPKQPLRYYREKELETEVVCDQCTLRYSVFGVFGFCPDCRCHNSRQILEKNLDLAIKTIAFAASAPSPEMKENLIQNALEDVVSSFDGFGRELVQAYSARASDSAKVENMSFQSLVGADKSLQSLFGTGLQTLVKTDDWALAVRCFHMRHVIAHKGGVIDEKYVERAGDPRAIAGRKVHVAADEVQELVRVARTMGEGLWSFFKQGTV